jgi:transposase
MGTIRPHTPPHTSAGDTTRDERLQIQTLYNCGLNYPQIREQLNLTLHQIAYAVNHLLTPKKRSGRPSMLSQEEIDHIIHWVCASPRNRRTAWAKTPIILELNISFYAIRPALRNTGFARRVARRKPHISKTNRRRRLQWAIEHADWSVDQ